MIPPEKVRQPQTTPGLPWVFLTALVVAVLGWSSTAIVGVIVGDWMPNLVAWIAGATLLVLGLFADAIRLGRRT